MEKGNWNTISIEFVCIKAIYIYIYDANVKLIPCF